MSTAKKSIVVPCPLAISRKKQSPKNKIPVRHAITNRATIAAGPAPKRKRVTHLTAKWKQLLAEIKSSNADQTDSMPHSLDAALSLEPIPKGV